MPIITDRAAFKAKYGPWAVITGASDGTGAAYARQLAAAGINLLLIARRVAPLTSLAAELATRNKIETRIASVDLYEPDAASQVVDATEGLEIGLFVSNAGADANNSSFLDAPMDVWRKLINRNVLVLSELTYALAGPMRQRGRGGIILMSSGTALGGQPGVAVYCATKAFDLNFAESLWAELGPFGIDVLSGVCPAMDTPSLQRRLAERGLKVPGLYDPEAVVEALIARLPDGPTHIFPFGPDAPNALAIERARCERAETMIEVSKMFSGK